MRLVTEEFLRSVEFETALFRSNSIKGAHFESNEMFCRGTKVGRDQALVDGFLDEASVNCQRHSPTQNRVFCEKLHKIPFWEDLKQPSWGRVKLERNYVTLFKMSSERTS